MNPFTGVTVTFVVYT